MKGFVFAVTEFLRGGGRVLFVHSGEGDETSIAATHQYIADHYRVALVVRNSTIIRPQCGDEDPGWWYPAASCEALDHTACAFWHQCAIAALETRRGSTPEFQEYYKGDIAEEMRAWGGRAFVHLDRILKEAGDIPGGTILVIAEDALLLHALALFVIRLADRELNGTLDCPVDVIMSRLVEPGGWLQIHARQNDPTDVDELPFEIETEIFPALSLVERRAQSLTRRGRLFAHLWETKFAGKT